MPEISNAELKTLILDSIQNLKFTIEEQGRKSSSDINNLISDINSLKSDINSLKDENKKIGEELSKNSTDMYYLFARSSGNMPEKSRSATSGHSLLEPRSNWQRVRSYGK